MYLSPTIQAARERKVQRVIDATNCTRDEAIGYLVAEEWFVDDAVTSYRVDRMSVCDHCGALVDGVVGAPDGREVCRSCFDAGVA